MSNIASNRFNTSSRRSLTYERRPTLIGRSRLISDIKPSQAKPATPKIATKMAITRAKPKPTPARINHSKVLMRQLVKPRRPARAKRPLNVRGWALASLSCLLVVFGVGIGLAQLNTNHKVKAQVKVLSAQSDGAPEATGDGPSETPTKDSTDSYRVSGLSPRIISIPKLGIQARTIRLGVKPNNEIKSPSNIYDAGWFEGSARPGESGAMLISGHVHGPTKPGVFFGLKKLTAGDKITIERGDGKTFNYKVVKSQSYDKDKVDMGAALNSAEPGVPGLNLITCDGNFDEAGNYQKRLVVFAVQQ